MNDVRLLDIRLLRLFDAIAEEENVSRAAERLHITQSAASGSLATLREVLGDQLFVRTQHGMEPTHRAQMLAPVVRDILQQIEFLCTPAEIIPRQFDGSLAIAAVDFVQSVLLVPFVQQIRATAPGLRLAIHPLIPSEIMQRLRSGELDLALTISQLIPEGLKTEVLFTERFVCAVRPTHPLAKRGRVTAKEFERYDHVFVSPAFGLSRGPVDDLLAELGLKRNIVVSLPNFLLAPQLLEKEDLIAVLPTRVAEMQGSKIKILPTPLKIPPVSIMMAWHPKAELNPILEWVRMQLKEVAHNPLALTNRVE